MVFVWSQPKYGLDIDTYIQGIFGVSQASTWEEVWSLAGSPSVTLHCHHMSLGRSLFLFNLQLGFG